MRSEAEDLLRQVIRSAPPLQEGRRAACALSELATHMGRRDGCLVSVGVSAGLTPSEAVGIMDGWDGCGGAMTTWSSLQAVDCGGTSHPIVPSEYMDGRRLGEALYNERHGVTG